MTPYDALTEVNAVMDRLCAVRETLGKKLADGSCQSSELRQMSDLHDRVALAIAAYKRGK